MDGIGLAIIGGSDEGPGVEIIEDDGETVTSLPFPPDPTTGAGAVLTGEQFVLVFGGRVDGSPAPTREFDLRCTDCEAEPIDRLAVDDLVSWVRAFKIPDGILVFGEAEADSTRPTRCARMPPIRFRASVVNCSAFRSGLSK